MKSTLLLLGSIYILQATVSNYTPSQSLEQMVIARRKPVVVKFYMPSCGPCQRIKPIIEDLSNQFAGRVDFIEVDIKQYVHIARNYGVMSAPTLLYFKNGQVVGRHKGFADSAAIKQEIQMYLL